MNEPEVGDFGEDVTMGPPQQHDFDDDKEKDEYLESLHQNEEEGDGWKDIWQLIGLESQGYSVLLMSIGVPKDPLYPKLLLLLEAGCDPNLQDADGLTPSDYVRGTRLWPDWERALTDSGWIYDTRVQQCIRQIEQEDE